MADETKLDDATARRLDSITEDEVARGWRIRVVPEYVQAAMRSATLEPVTRIRLSKINPARRRDINEVVQRRYHADLRDPNVMSDTQILKLVAERGEWTADNKVRMDELQAICTRENAKLWQAGLTPDTNEFRKALREKIAAFQQGVAESELTPAERQELAQVFERWYGWSPAADYTAAAELQGRARYSPEADWQWVIDHSPRVEEQQLVADIEELKDKQDALQRLNEMRVELAELQVKHARIFAGSAESRQNHCEEMATLYFTCERLDASNAPLGRLAKDFDGLYNFPNDAVTWLLFESLFFHNDIADEARDYLEVFGFLKAEREPTSPSGGAEASDASPVPPASKTASEPVAVTASSSSALLAVTT